MYNEELDNAIKSSFPLYKQERFTDSICVEKINVTNYDFEHTYKNHLGLYRKYEDYKEGIITFRTFGSGDYCSYFYRHKSDGEIDGSIVNLPPFYEDYIKLYPDYDLYTYDIGLVQKNKEKRINSRMKTIFDSLPDFVTTALVFFVLFLPAIVLLSLNVLEIIHINDSIITAAVFLNLFLLLYLADVRRRKHKELAKKRAIYFNGYKEGCKDCQYQNEKEESH